MHFAAQGDTVVGRVKTYIQEHLSEEINRANVAKGFFLNPDYLARLFKKETGQTLGKLFAGAAYFRSEEAAVPAGAAGWRNCPKSGV